ncbi:hypothetical protein HRI_000891400 [Hibiscus trionum]|uniref:Endonuclease/exonuclease/phosphatase domain-containing protein n=1 Tax=Hibiscus trionum TaxID=183268 RepID=A0A9W7H8K2_HIBTR|nr:hypothetical protein HRI_000891400 [Hibiscus trionum]
MKVLSWNIRGLGTSSKCRAVQRIVRQHQVEMVFLQETKLELITEQIVKKVWHSDNFVFVFAPAVGRSGGLLVVWEATRFQLEKTEVQQQYIALWGRWVMDDWKCGMMNIYAPCSIDGQRELWENIVIESQKIALPWCVAGDFNVVKTMEERRCCYGSQQGMTAFVSFIEGMGLIDVKVVGKCFTWFGSGNKCSRLDRFLISEEWIDRFMGLRQYTLCKSVSDHAAIKLACEEVNWGHRPFRFLNCWLEKKVYVQDMAQEWEKLMRRKTNGQQLTLLEKLDGLCRFLRNWNRNSFGSVEQKIESTSLLIDEMDGKMGCKELSEVELDERRKLQGEL